MNLNVAILHVLASLELYLNLLLVEYNLIKIEDLQNESNRKGSNLTRTVGKVDPLLKISLEVQSVRIFF